MRIFVFVTGVELLGIALGAAIAHGQTGLDIPGNGISPSSSRMTQSGPISGEGAVAEQNALATIGLEGANNSREAGVAGSERADMKVDEQTERASVPDARAGAAATSNTWRYAKSNGHWWYWMANDRWAFRYRDRWVPFDAKTYGQYYPTGANSANPTAIRMSGPNPRYRAGYGGSPAGGPPDADGDRSSAAGPAPSAGQRRPGVMDGSGAKSNGGGGVPAGMGRSRGDSTGALNKNPLGSSLSPDAGAGIGRASGGGGGPGSPNTGYPGGNAGSAVGGERGPGGINAGAGATEGALGPGGLSGGAAGSGIGGAGSGGGIGAGAGGGGSGAGASGGSAGAGAGGGGAGGAAGGGAGGGGGK